MITITNLTSGYSVTVTPSSFKWSLQDVSAADSGRNVEGTMYKNMITQKRKLELEFPARQWTEVSSLLQAVNSEYFTVRYPDMLSGTFETRTFYCGDREVPVYTWFDNQKVVSNITFNVIER